MVSRKIVYKNHLLILTIETFCYDIRNNSIFPALNPIVSKSLLSLAVSSVPVFLTNSVFIIKFSFHQSEVTMVLQVFCNNNK